MERLARNFIFLALVVSSVCVADLSSASDGKINFSYCDNYEIQFTEKNFVGMPTENNSEFWSKFRESVMPNDSQKNKVPNYEKNPPPPNKNMPGVPPKR